MYGRTGGKAMDVMDQFGLRHLLGSISDRMVEEGGVHDMVATRKIPSFPVLTPAFAFTRLSSSNKRDLILATADTGQAKALELAGEFIPEMNQQMYSKTETSTKAGSAMTLGA
eukprot:COSAG02_NODE_19880_length_860_cov_1.282523_2_plen_112_part_01